MNFNKVNLNSKARHKNIYTVLFQFLIFLMDNTKIKLCYDYKVKQLLKHLKILENAHNLIKDNNI